MNVSGVGGVGSLIYNSPKLAHFANRALARFYARVVRPGELSFDIGEMVPEMLRPSARLGAAAKR